MGGGRLVERYSARLLIVCRACRFDPGSLLIVYVYSDYSCLIDISNDTLTWATISVVGESKFFPLRVFLNWNYLYVTLPRSCISPVNCNQSKSGCSTRILSAVWNAWTIFGMSTSGSDSSIKEFSLSSASRIVPRKWLNLHHSACFSTNRYE